MLLFKDIDKFPKSQNGCVVTIGKFDGVHLGHQLIFDQLKSQAVKLDSASLVIVIEPHPEEFFARHNGRQLIRLNTIREKLELLETVGVDFVYQFNFDETTSEISAESYIKDILVNGLGIRGIIIGDDFRFGKNRIGNYSLLEEYGEKYDYQVFKTAAYERNGHRISSTFVREQLLGSNFDLVTQVLGRPYSITGKVLRGQQLGATLGFPTCNVDPGLNRIPLRGVFACEVKLGSLNFKAAVNLGYRPTVDGEKAVLLEAHILDFNEDVYGQLIEVMFRKKIRDELKFDGIDALKTQIGIDVEEVRIFFDEDSV